LKKRAPQNIKDGVILSAVNTHAQDNKTPSGNKPSGLATFLLSHAPNEPIEVCDEKEKNRKKCDMSQREIVESSDKFI